MEKFVRLEGLVAPLDRNNVDTDAIIPKQFLKSIHRSGFGPNCFDEWRYLDHGEPGMDCSKRPLNPAFVLNQPRYRGAQVLLTRKNFGCGSSREHAPWALLDCGFRVILAESFADIFYNNCFKNGILPIVLTAEQIGALFVQSTEGEGVKVVVDLPLQRVLLPNGDAYGFDVDPFRKECLINGWDDIGLTLRHADEISAYEEKRKHEQPWLFA